MALLLSLIFAIVSVIHIASITCASPPADTTHLHINVVTGINGASAFQCWAVDPPFAMGTAQGGTADAKIQSFGNITNGDVVLFDPTHDVNAGPHNAPSRQWGYVALGSGIITLPTTNASILLPTGSILIALDTADVSKLGHASLWTAGTAVLQLPFKDGVAPRHKVIDPHGPCPGSAIVRDPPAVGL